MQRVRAICRIDFSGIPLIKSIHPYPNPISQPYQETARAWLHFIVADTALELPVSRADSNKAARTLLSFVRGQPVSFVPLLVASFSPEPYAGNRRYNVFMGLAPWRGSECGRVQIHPASFRYDSSANSDTPKLRKPASITSAVKPSSCPLPPL